MQRTLLIAPLTWWEKLADVLMTPVMVMVSGTARESPQRTHMWNSMSLDAGTLQDFDVRIMVTAPSSPRAISSRGVRFHVPILGGWREYVVIQPSVHNTRAWHIGWMGGSCGVSRITVTGAARMLRGPGESRFFGVDARTGEQIPLEEIGRGRVGDGGRWKKLPLL